MDLNNMVVKSGYTLDDKPEFRIVRNFILEEGGSTKNFDENLKTLMISKRIRASKYKGFCQYDPFLNRILGSDKGIGFIHELFHMASNRDKEENEIGVMFADGTGESLNEGIVEFLTVCATNSPSESYPLEILFFEFLTQMYYEIRKELVIKFFDGNPLEYYKLFGEDEEMVLDAVRELDKFTIEMKDRATKYRGESIYMEPTDSIKENLVNAFSKLLKKFVSTRRSYAIDLIEDFEDVVYSKFDEINAGEIVSLFEDKLEIDKSL